MSVRHVLAPGGHKTCCGCSVTQLDKGHTAGHRMGGRICQLCRAQLRTHPQLVNAIVAELRASGLALNVGRLQLAPARTVRLQAHRAAAAHSAKR